MGRLVSIADICSTNESSAGGSSNISTSTFRTAPTGPSFPTSRDVESGHGGAFNNMINSNNSGLATCSTLSSLTTATGSSATASRTTTCTSSGRRSGQVSIADLGGATNKGGGSIMSGTTTTGGGGGGGSATTTNTLFRNNATDSSVAAAMAGPASPKHDSDSNSPLHLRRHHHQHHETSFSTTGPNEADDSPHVHHRDHPAGPMGIAHLGRVTTGNAPMQFAEHDMSLRVLTEEEGEGEEDEEMIIPLPYCYGRERITTGSFVLNDQTTTSAGANEGGDGDWSMSDNEGSVSSLMALAEAEEKSGHPSPLFGVGPRILASGAAASLGGARTIQDPEQGILHSSLAPPRRRAAGALTYGYHEKENCPFPSYPPAAAAAAAAAAAPLAASEKKGTVVRLTDLRKTAASHTAPMDAATCESNATATSTPTTIELVESVKVMATLENDTTTEKKLPLKLAPAIAPNNVVAVLECNDTPPPPPPPPHDASHTIMNENDSKNYNNSDRGNDRSVQEATVVGELFESSPFELQQEQLQGSSSSLSSGLNSDTLVEKADEEWGIPMSVVFTPSQSMSHAPIPIVQSIGNRLERWRSQASRGSPRLGMKKMLNPNATSTTSIPTTTTSASYVDSEQQLRQSREEPDSGHDGGPWTTRTTPSMDVGHMEQLPTSAVYHVEVSGTSGETQINSAKSCEGIADSKPVLLRWVNVKSVFFAVVCTIVVVGLAFFAVSTRDR